MNPLNWTPRQLIAVRAILTLVLAAMVASNVRAGTITSTWRAPTLYTDGSTITSAVTYRVEVGPEGQAFTTSVPSTALSVSIPNIAPGRWCVRIYAIVAGVDSDPTAPSCVSVPGLVAKKPNPAYGVTTTAVP